MADIEKTSEFAMRKNFFFPTAEIYAGSPAGFWEYGPDGVKIKNNILKFWRKNLIEAEGFVEIEGSVILPEKVFVASGHLNSFNDPIVQCKKTAKLHRADKILEEALKKTIPEAMDVSEMTKLIRENNVKSPDGGELSDVRQFNMMMKVDIGAIGDITGYLRPETCQNIFLNFQRVYKNSRQNLPLGLAQAGSSFRNEIAPKQTLLRERELGQMEIEVFFNPENENQVERFEEVKNYQLNLETLKRGKIVPTTCETAVNENLVSSKLAAYLLARLQQFYENIGIPNNAIKFRELDENTRAFYAKETWDFEVLCEGKWVELVACNNRTDYDLKSHERESKQKQSIKEEGKDFTPHVFELSAGIDRTFYAVICHSLKKEKRGQDERNYLSLNQDISPYFVSIFPLVKKDGLFEKGQEIKKEIDSWGIDAFFDEKGSIGKRYARMDELGVKYAITIDYDSMKDNTVTLRERDTLEQKRVKIENLSELLLKIKLKKLDFNSI